MSAQTYDLLVSLLGSALAGLVLFLAGVALGYLFWGHLRNKARAARTLGDTHPEQDGATGRDHRP